MGDPIVIASSITSGSGIIIALIGAWVTSGKAVAAATAPLIHDIARYRERIIELGGDPDAK